MADAGSAPAAGGGLPLCASAALQEGGRAWVWDVLLHRQPARAFALRSGGRVVAYINRCLHVPTEMDWTPGEFLDASRRWILCSIHGAAYDPADGRCVGGPCGRGRLAAVSVEESGEQVRWYPSRDIQAACRAESAAASAPQDDGSHRIAPGGAG